MSRTFSIPEERLLTLLKSEDELLALLSAGVDNWSGGDDAYELIDHELQDSSEIPEHLIGVDFHEL